MKKMMVMAATMFAFASCQKEEIAPVSKETNDQVSLGSFEFEEIGTEHELVEVKESDQPLTVYVYHFFDTDEVSGNLIVEKENGETVTFSFEPKHLRDTFNLQQNTKCYYLKRSIDVSYEEVLNMNGWFNTMIHLNENTGYIRNVNFFNGEVAQRTETPTYCGINPVSSVYQTNQLATSFWLDFSALPAVDEGATLVN